MVLLIPTLVLGACSGTGGGGEAATAGSDLERRVAELDLRLAELERAAVPSGNDAGDAPTSPATDRRLDDLDAAFDALAARVDDLAQDVGGEAAARTLADAEAAAATREVEQRLRTLVAELDALRAQVESLTVRVDRIATR